MSNPTISETTTAPGFWQWDPPGTTIILRTFNISPSYMTADDQWIPIGQIAVADSCCLETPVVVQNDLSLAIPAIIGLPFTTNSSRPTARFSSYFYDSQGTQRNSWLLNYAIGESLGGTPTWANIFRYNAAKTLVNPPSTYWNVSQVISYVLSVVAGTSAPKMTTVINGIGKLFEAALNSTIPIVVGPNSIFVNSARTITKAAAKAASRVTGVVSKLTNGNQGTVYDNGTGVTRSNLGVFNPLDFGALDDGATNSRLTLQATIDACIAEGGGVARLSYSDTGNYQTNTALTVGSKMVIEGEVSAQGAKTRLTLTGNNKSLLTVGEDLKEITFRNLELFTAGTGNTGIKFTGTAPNSTQIINFENCTINGFDTSISVDGGGSWQCSYVAAFNLTLYNCDTGLHLDSANSDWNFDNLRIFARTDGVGVDIDSCGALNFSHPTFIGGINGAPGSACTLGVPNPAYSDVAIRVNGTHGPIHVVNGQLEGFRSSLEQNHADWSYPFIFENTIMIAPFKLNDDCTVSFHGNTLADNSIQIPNGVDVRMDWGLNFVSDNDVCGDPGTGLGGASIGTGSYMVKRTSVYGTDHQMPVMIGAKRPVAATGDPTNPANPLFGVGASDTDHNLIRFGAINATTKVWTNYYDLTRDGDGYGAAYGNQASPNVGWSINGPLQLKADATAAAPAGTKGRLNWTGALLQWLTASMTYNVLLASTVLTVNRLVKATANGVLANSLWSDDGTNTQLISGLLRFLGATASFPALKRSGTTLAVRLADDSADAPMSAFTGTFSGAVATPSLAVNGGTALTTTNATGTGSLVKGTSPTLTTPDIGVATATSVTFAAAVGGGVVAEQRLSTTASVNLNVNTKTTLYTVPAGKTLIVTKVVVRAASTSLTTAEFGLGFNANADDVIAVAIHSELTGATLFTLIPPKNGAIRGAAADVFGVRCNVVQGGAATCTIEVWGEIF